MSLQTRTFGATNFTYFNGFNNANITSPLGLDNEGSRISGAMVSGNVPSALRPIRIRNIQIEFTDSAGTVNFKLSTGNNTADVWTSGDISATTTRNTNANHPAFTNSTLFYGFRKKDTSITRVRRGDVPSEMFFNGSALNGPIRATITWQTAPNAPTSVSVTNKTATSVSLSWVKPSDTGGTTALSGYRILYKKTTDSSWSSTGKFGSNATTTRTVSGLEPNNEYQFLVAATNVVTDGHNADYSSNSAHTGTNSAQITETTLGGARVWNGSSFVFGTVRVWKGSSFAIGTVRVWDGSSWVSAK